MATTTIHVTFVAKKRWGWYAFKALLKLRWKWALRMMLKSRAPVMNWGVDGGKKSVVRFCNMPIHEALA